MTAALACLELADQACARNNFDTALTLCADRSDWGASYWSTANRVYPDRYEAELEDAIERYDPDFDTVITVPITFEYRALLERADFRAALAAKTEALREMVARYQAAAASGDLKLLLNERGR